MNILQVNKFHFPFAGSEKVVFNTAELLRERGHSVEHFAIQHDKNLPSSLSAYFPSGLDLSPESAGGFSLSKKLSTFFRFCWFREGHDKIREATRNAFKPDVAHLHNIYHHLSPSVAAGLKKNGIPTVLTLHDFKLVCPTYSLFRNGDVCEECAGGKFSRAVANRCVRGSLAGSAVCAMEAYFHSMTGLYTRNVDLFISPSEFLKNKYIEMGFPGENIRVLPNFAAQENDDSQTAPKKHALFMGRLHPTKGAALLLEATAPLKESGIKLVIAGTGEEDAALRVRAEQLSLPVTFAGFQTGAALENLIKEARFGVVPSIWYENCPMVVIEFWRRGIPVIASDWGGLSEMVDHEKNGLLFKPGDAAALTSAMKKLWDDPALCEKLGADGKQKAADKYGPDRHYEELMKIYEEAISSSKHTNRF